MIRIMGNLFISGLLFGSGPCLASCGPLLISYIAGTRKDVLRSLIAYMTFSLSRMAAYFTLALLIFFLGRFTVESFAGQYAKYIYLLGGSFITVIGIIMVLGKHLIFKFLNLTKIQKVILEKDTKSVVLFGLIVGFLPCAPLIAILSFIGLISKSWLQSLTYSLSFGLGTLLSPLVLLIIFTGLIPKIITQRAAIYYRIFSFICGLVIIFLGIQLIYRGV